MSESKKVILHEVAAQRILMHIKERRLQSGDKLPAERELAKMLGMSRTSLRETLQILAANNAVTIKPGSGIYVDTIDETMLSSYILTENERGTLLLIKKLIQARLMLETFCFQEVSKIITTEQIQMLYAREEYEHKKLYPMDGIQKGTATASLAFEAMIVGMQPNNLLTNMHKRLSTTWSAYFLQTDFLALPPEHRHRDHTAIIEAIESGSRTRIAKSVAAHLNKIASAIDEIFEA